MAVSVFPAPSSSLQQYEEIFYTSGTWNRPANCKTVEVMLLGAGGGSSAYVGGAGGFFKGVFDVSSVSSVPITIGAGGAAGNGSTNGTRGGRTSFGSFAFAGGGFGGTTSRSGGSGGVRNFIYPQSNEASSSDTYASANSTDTGGSEAYAHGNSWYATNGTIATAVRGAQQNATSSYYRSVDGGSTWTVISMPVTSGVAWTFWNSNNSLFYLINSNGAWTSSTAESGTWTSLGSHSGNTPDFQNGGIIFDGTNFYGRSGNRLVVSSTGNSWAFTGVTTSGTNLRFLRYTNGGIFSVECQGNDNSGIAATFDGGATWRYFNVGAYYHNDVVYLPALDRYAISYKWNGSRIELWSFNGTTFTFTGNLASASWTFRISSNPINPNQIIYASSEFGVFFSSNGGATFTQVVGHNFSLSSSDMNSSIGIIGGNFINVRTSFSNTPIYRSSILIETRGNFAHDGTSAMLGNLNTAMSLDVPEYTWFANTSNNYTQQKSSLKFFHPILMHSGFGGIRYSSSNWGSTSPGAWGGVGITSPDMIASLALGYGNGGSYNEGTSSFGAGRPGIAIIRYMA